MELRREILLSLGALIFVNLLFAAGAIGLFVRMGPAIGQILAENAFSIEAAETMLGELALAGDRPVTEPARAKLLKALVRMEGNVTEQAERAPLADLRKNLNGALAGTSSARTEFVKQLMMLIDVNRAAMRKADEDALRLGRAGAWAAVFMGLLSLMVGLGVISRLHRRLLMPLLELFNVLEQAAGGDKFRRCRSDAAPAELGLAMSRVNTLLDAKLKR